MKIVSYAMVIEVNLLLNAMNSEVKLHLRDACGAPSLWLEYGNLEQLNEPIYTCLDEFFRKQGFTLRYNQEKTEMVAIAG